MLLGSATGDIVVDIEGEIPEWEYWNCPGITSITIGDKVTSIGKAAFSDCPGAQWVIIGNSVHTIGESAFAGLQVTEITIPPSVTTLGPHAFKWCDLLTTITIPASITSIGEGAFRWCKALADVTYEGVSEPSVGTKVFDSTLVTTVYVPEEYSNNTFGSENTVTKRAIVKPTTTPVPKPTPTRSPIATPTRFFTKEVDYGRSLGSATLLRLGVFSWIVRL